MNTPTIPALVLPFLVMVGILVGTGQPVAAEPVVGACSNAPATNMVVDFTSSSFSSTVQPGDAGVINLG